MGNSTKYEQFFSNWLYDNLPLSKDGCVIQDIDFIIQNYKTKKFIIIELKTRGNQLTNSQKTFYNMLHKRLINTNNDGRTYNGTYSIEFEGDDFYDGNVYLSGCGIKKQEVYQNTLQEFLYNKLGFIV